MAEHRLTTQWQLDLEVITPVHVGSGSPRLLADYDFVTEPGTVWVIDPDQAWDRLSAEALLGQPDIRLSHLLAPADYAACARYRLALRGRETPAEIIPILRGPAGQPYLPGSTLKGAFRTAFAWLLAQTEQPPLDPAALGPNPKYAAAPWERRLLGPNPNQDLLRALRIADASAAEPVAAELATAAVYSLRGQQLEPKGPGYRWFVEALPAGARLTARASLDEYLFGPGGQSLHFHGRRAIVADPATACRAFATALIAAEEGFYQVTQQPGLAAFYRRLGDRLAACGPGEGLLQLGWGTGWRAKTILWQHEADPAFVDVVRRYHLDRDRDAGIFPKTRRLIERGGTPEEPLGWVWFRLDSVGG